MSIFIDTSAFLAVLDADDEKHGKAKVVWKELIEGEEPLACTNYILVEILALLQHRLGISALQTFQEDIVPLLDIEWIDEISHRAGIVSMLAVARRKLSLVDCVSFETMHRLGIRSVFTFDKHFKEQGFECMP